MPSVLAIRDLRRRWHRILREVRPGDDQLVALLKLDPLTVLRGLRSANASVFEPCSDPTVRGLVRQLGPAVTLRLLDLEPIPVANTARVRELWRHSIAAAIAAEELADSSGLLNPELAYLLGLLHDLPDWLEELSSRAPADAPRIPVTELIASMQLPAAVIEPLRRMREVRGNESDVVRDVPTLLCQAERMADLADFQHPNVDGPSPDLALLTTAGRMDLLAAQRLRRRVEAVLRSFGLDPTVPDTEFGDDEPSPLLSGLRRGDLASVMLSIFGCTRSESYRGIVTAVTAAALRYGDYDRAFFARCNPGSGQIVLRSKADASSRRLRTPHLRTTAREREALRAALESERPTLIRRQTADDGGLLDALSVDEVLAIPLNREFATPAFLFVDRGLTMRRIDPDTDVVIASTLGMTGSLLIENLLLRRRRQRAQSSALTDPLTRLHNRRLGLVQLEQEVARARRSQRPLTVLMCDLDHFKQLNDQLGHLQGDVALRETAKVLRDTLRKGDTICRYGGEEFLVVLPETSPDDGLVLATRLFTSVYVRGEEVGMPISISIGMTTYREGDSANALLERADRALYASKGSGRNGFSADVEETAVASPTPAR